MPVMVRIHWYIKKIWILLRILLISFILDIPDFRLGWLEANHCNDSILGKTGPAHLWPSICLLFNKNDPWLLYRRVSPSGGYSPVSASCAVCPSGPSLPSNCWWWHTCTFQLLVRSVLYCFRIFHIVLKKNDLTHVNSILFLLVKNKANS